MKRCLPPGWIALSLAFLFLSCGGEVQRPERMAAGTQYMVAAPTPEAVEAGRTVLAGGGNAIDAAAAAAAALWVTDPAMASVGGRAQILIRLADGSLVGIDGATQAPLRLGEPATIGHGYGTSPVPGAPAAIQSMLEEYGTLSWEEILAPAIRLAEEGFILQEDIPEALNRYGESLWLYPGTREHFLKADGSPYSVGELFRQPTLGRTLRVLSQEGARALYEGALADAMVADMEANGGLVHHDDLAQYRPLEGPVVHGDYRGFEIMARGGNCDGASVIQMLQMLEHFDLGSYEITDPEYIHILAQTLYLANRERHGPDSIQTSKAHAAELVRGMDLGRAFSMKRQGGTPRSGETNHLSVVDAQGNAVALTQSIGNSFGSKVVNPELGFFYAYSYDMNDDPVPLQREWTSQSPTILTKDGELFFSLGSAGSNRIPGSIVRTVTNVIDHGMTLEEALAARRWYIFNDELRIEGEGLPDSVKGALEAMGYRLNLYPSPDGYFARVHAILVDPDTGLLTGGSDPRDHGGAGGR